MGSKMSNPAVRMVLVDGTEFEVQTLTIDLIAWEADAAKNKWPDFRTANIMWISYLGWHAARREGILQPSVTWDVFRREMIADVGSPEGEASTDVPPTDQAADID